MDLGRLQVRECLGGLVHAFPAARLFVERGRRLTPRLLGRAVGTVPGERALSQPAKRERLVLYDRVQPGPELAPVGSRSLRQEDLVSALVSNPLLAGALQTADAWGISSKAGT